MRGTITALILLCSIAGALAANIRGKVTDNADEPMMQATVRLLAAKDSTYVNGLKTKNDGSFVFTGVKAGKYIVEASYLGYNNTFVDVTVGSANVSLKPIVLNESSIMLQEVSVTGVKTQIKVSEDTVEYNADSYKTQPNAVVEDLLKRLPGVEVDSDGKITANGKEVSKILIDGKEFFSDDPKVASKNLPVEMIEKLQVVDRKSDLARLTGVDDGEDETVINLSVKKNMKNGYFGTVEGGYGTDQRYLGTFNVNKFWGDNQVTLLGNFNNVNQLGFTDSNGNRFRRFGGTNGINVSQALGVNFNVGNKEIFRVGGDVMYSHSDRTSLMKRERQYLFPDSSSWSTSGQDNRNRGHNIRADFRIQWNPDSFNTLEIRPNISYNLSHTESLDSTMLRAGDALRSPVNRSFNTTDSKGHSIEFGLNFIYNHKFRSRPGRSFSVQARYNHSNVREDETTYSLNRFFMLNDSIDLYDQLQDNHTWSDNVNSRISWTEPIGDVKNGNFITASYRIQYRWNNSDKIVDYHPVIPGIDGGMPELDYSQILYADSLSNRFRNDYFNQDIRLGFKHVSKTHNLDVGISLVPSMLKSIDLINEAKNIPSRWVWNFAPYMRYRFKISRTSSFNVDYRARSTQPSVTQLQPVDDVSDPLNIVRGNPELKPTFTHNMNVRYQNFNAESQRSIMVMTNWSLTQNSIVSRTSYNSLTGGRLTEYVNVNGVWNGNLMAMYSQPLRNKAWQVSAHTFNRISRTIGYNNGEENRSTSLNVSFMPSIAFRPSNLEFELRPRYSLQHTVNSLKSTGNMNVHSYGGSFHAYYYTPIGIVLDSDLNYSATKGYSNGYDTHQWLWNASISYQTLRDRSLTFAVKAYDLLQQRSSISRSVTANYIDDTRYNNLTRYFMFTVSYRFNTFGKGNRPSENSRWGGPGGPGIGPGGGGRPPRH